MKVGTKGLIRTILGAICASAAFLCSGQTNARPNLLLVSIDTLRADHVGCYGYREAQTPNIDRLAAEGVLFKTVVSQVPLTLPSHCTILTGTYPTYHGVRDNVGFRLADSRTTLAEILKARGYATSAFIGAYVLNSKFGLNQGFDEYDDRIAAAPRQGPVVNLNSVERPAGEVVSRAMYWLETHRQLPFFMWVHLYDPHDPYEPPAPFREQYRNKPYDGEIAYADRELGRLLELLKRKRLYDNTVVVLLSDHGESFGEHQEWTHGYFIYDTTLLVPLIIKPAGNGSPGRIVTEQVSLVDVAPTAMQLAGVQPPAEVQGRGLMGTMLGQSRPAAAPAYSETWYPAQFGWSPLASIRREDAKYIRAPRPELYNLRTDAGEKNNVVPQQSALAGELKSALAKLESTYTDRDAGKSARLELSSQQLDELRALGYVGISGAHDRAPAGPAGAADPKDKVKLYQMISAGSQDVAAGQYRRALPVLEQVLKLEPGMRMALSMAGRCYFELGQFAAARKAFAEILKEHPDNLDARFYAAACDYREKNYTGAESGFRRILQSDPNYAAAHLYLGFLHQARGDSAAALASFRRVLQLDPNNEDAHAKTAFLLASRGQIAEAVPHFQKVIALDPGDAEAHSNLGVAYMKLGREELARKEFAEACRLEKRYCR
jgi:choline-sulfatase